MAFIRRFRATVNSEINSELEIDIPEKRRVWGPWATAGFGAVIIIIFFVVTFVVGIIFSAVVMFYEPELFSGVPELIDAINNYAGLLVSITTIATAVVGIALILIIIIARRGPGIAEYLGFRRITVKDIVLLLGISMVFLVVAVFINWALNRDGDSTLITDIYDSSIWPALLWIALVGFAPAFEEIFVRGFLFAGFLQSRLGAVGAVVITAFVWAILHLQYGFYEIVTIFIFGVILGLVRYKTRSLWGPIMTHASYNFLALLLSSLNI